jgi:putative sterol carrier protein
MRIGIVATPLSTFMVPTSLGRRRRPGKGETRPRSIEKAERAMSDALDKALEALREKIGDQEVDGSVKLDFTDEGVLRIDEQGCRIDDGTEADVTISADTATFRGMFEGDVNPTAAFMSGRLRIAGDMGVAMRVASLLG